MHNEINVRFSATNKRYNAMKEMFLLKLQSRQTKERLHTIYLRHSEVCM